MPIEGGAFYHADLVDSSKPIYREHFTKILLAYSLWLNDVNFDVQLATSQQKSSEKVSEQREKLFFMLLGLSMETLSNTTTGFGQLADETIENILESLDYLIRTQFGRRLLAQKSVYLCVEILSVLYKYISLVLCKHSFLGYLKLCFNKGQIDM